MGRRTLRRIDPALDLSQHLKSIDELTAPLSTQLVFGHAAPLEIEVGCGKGLFLHSVSGAVPEHCFLGCEVARSTHASPPRNWPGHNAAMRCWCMATPGVCFGST